MTIQEKALAVAKTVKEKGGLMFDVNMSDGTVSINGISFDMSEQMAYVEMYKNDPTFSQILNTLNSQPEAKAIKNAVKFGAEGFEVDKEKLNESMERIKAEKELEAKKVVVPFPTGYSAPDSKPKEDKDATIEELRKEIDRLNGIISHEVDSSENSIREEDLHIDDFYFAELHPLADEITDEEIQVIIDELKGVEVPFGSFVLHRTGNVAILKIHDDEGITYMVAEDYLFANVK